MIAPEVTVILLKHNLWTQDWIHIHTGSGGHGLARGTGTHLCLVRLEATAFPFIHWFTCSDTLHFPHLHLLAATLGWTLPPVRFTPLGTVQRLTRLVGARFGGVLETCLIWKQDLLSSSGSSAVHQAMFYLLTARALNLELLLCILNHSNG